MDQATALRELVRNSKPTPINARVITVTSGKGGVGKSSVAVNLAIAFAKQGRRVIILDADFGLANVEVMLGVRPTSNLADLMFRNKSIKDIITEGPNGIGFISGGSGIQEMTNLSKEQLINLSARLTELDELSDIIIIDTGAGISDAVMEFVMASSEVLLVATPEPTSITDAYALLKTLNKKTAFVKEHSKIQLIANRVGDPDEGLELYNKLSLVVGKFLDISISYLGSVPKDNLMVKSVMMQKPVMASYPESQAARSFENLASKMLGLEPVAPSGRRGIAGLFFSVLGRRQ
ncbi:MAG: MinD/ParA family protein [Lachnospiraceae bacterium]|jgi:flagellar biosynthesis protein FlhG|nr:MinD/ParA family protein [Lachnospiraceae bacterium]MCR4779104.1 MinD/ParA family protein [Lachnospiraceae bacterium]